MSDKCTDGTERKCVFGHDWCDGPDADLESGEPFDGICGSCFIQRGKEETSPEPGADPWCDWCDDGLEGQEVVWVIEGEDGGTWPPAFCSRECALCWGNAETQGREYRVDRSVLAGVGDDYDPEDGAVALRVGGESA